jgi:membrane-associated phospholipid phosphatase
MTQNPDNRETPDDPSLEASGSDPGGRGNDSLLRRIVARVTVAQRRALFTRLAIATTLVAVLTYINTAFLGWSVAVGAAVAMVPLSRVRLYAIAFLPYGALWLGFTLLRSMANETGIPLRTDEVTRIERWMFFGETPTIWLQSRMFDPLNMAWYDYFTTFIHWSYFFLPHLAAILIWRHSPALYRRFLAMMLIVLGVGLAIYFITPAAPPWLTADRAPQDDIYRVMANVGRQMHSGLYDRTYSALGDPNPVAAMPSMHQAVTVAACLFVLHSRRRWLRWGALVYSILMAYTLVYTGEHYVIDIIVGSGIAIYAYAVAGRWMTAMDPLYQSAFRRHRKLSNDRSVPQASPVHARIE